MTNQYPDIVDFIIKSVKEDTNDFIIDSELVAYDTVNNKILPF
jgi:DNA ligase-1